MTAHTGASSPRTPDLAHESAIKDASEVLQGLGSSPTGLAEDEVARRLAEYGPNEVGREKHEGWLQRLYLAGRNPLVVLLTVLAILSFATGDFRAGTVQIDPAQGQPVTLHCDWIVNCTGPGRGRRLLEEPLFADLHRAGLLTPEALGLGLRVDVDNAAIGAGGEAVRGLWAVGPLARGSRFEATAVPELRIMAEATATQALEMLERDAPEAAEPPNYFYVAMPVGDLSHMVAALPASVSMP